ncbi:hypothetical protein IW261DRAFT_1563454 [Armillaria novae-zelandiae]|uniref:Uncharacterized protein n=1 Tax=Armillaria novae-zelandiae TaxID=153914 RepID=A0AA39TCX8_9AGAR|nr:hypothetical protein IW261DRAFT_1563454 [Armillaria novae-zelandiae]
MATPTDIPPDLTNDDKVYIVRYLDAQSNCTILGALLLGIYTGILAVTLWNMFINKCWPIRRAIVVVIVLLYALITTAFAASWSYLRSIFIENGSSFWTMYIKLISTSQAAYMEKGIAASISTIVADLYIIWCCWMVWERRWLVVLLPTLSLISATVLRIIEAYYGYSNGPGIGLVFPFPLLYISFVLATTLSCTLLIVYRILTVAGVKRGANGRLKVYQHFLEVLIESSALYSISLIVYLALTSCGNFGAYYLDVIASIMKGIAPTLLIGRAAAGHTRPQDDCEGSIVSSLHFQAATEVGTITFQESTMESTVLETDIEAQHQQSDELVVVVERT